jgi:hypothetical protein
MRYRAPATPALIRQLDVDETDLLALETLGREIPGDAFELIPAPPGDAR